MSHATLAHRLVRVPVAWAGRAGLTPNQLTLARLLTGIGAAAGFAAGGRAWPAIGGGLLLVSMLLDRADGQLARLTGKISASGTRYDLAADGLSTVAVFVGMGIGSRSSWGVWAILLGAVAAVCVVVLFVLTQALEPATGEPVVRPFDPDDAMFCAPFLVWAGLMPQMVVAAAVISPAVALALGARLLGRRRAAPALGS